LHNGLLFRPVLIKLAEDEYYFSYTILHIICDLWSLRIINQEFLSLYEAYSVGRSSPLPDLTLQYADFAQWERKWFSGEVYRAHLDYWKGYLNGMEHAFLLPTDRPRPPRQNFESGEEVIILPVDLQLKLKQLSRQESTTLYILLLSAFKMLMHRYTGVHDVFIGTAVAGRNQLEVEGMVGHFVNLLVRRTGFGGDPTYREALDRLGQSIKSSYAFQDMPFSKLVEELRPELDSSYTPFVQASFTLHHIQREERVEFSGVELSIWSLDTGTIPFEIIVNIVDSPVGLAVGIDYRTELFDVETILRMLGHYRTILESVERNVEGRLSDLSLLTTSEVDQLTRVWPAIAIESPEAPFVHKLVEEQADARPDAVAVVSGNTALSYAVMNRQANRIARYLREAGVRRDVVVAVDVKPSPLLAAVLLGILKTGAAYVFIDCAGGERQEGDALTLRTRILITDWDAARDLNTNWTTIRLEQIANQITLLSDVNLENQVDSGALPFVEFDDSVDPMLALGVSQEALYSQAISFRQSYQFSASDRACGWFAVAGDAPAWLLWSCLASGGSVSLADEAGSESAPELAEFIRAQSITVAWLSAGVAEDLIALHPPVDIAPLRLLLTPCPVGSCPRPASPFELPKFYNRACDQRVATGGKLSQTTDHWTPRPGPSTAIGKVLILDDYLKPAPLGVQGQIYIGEQGVAGYFDSAGQTALRFVPDPFQNKKGSRLFRTDDRACYTPDQEVMWKGKVDNRVVVSGVRVQLEDIEFVLGQYPGVQRAIVLATGRSQGDRRLTAFVAPRKGKEIDVEALEQFVRGRLPIYAVPGSILLLEALPLKSDGRVDREALGRFG
jgi:non-ribosomal peptide synthetase component F